MDRKTAVEVSYILCWMVMFAVSGVIAWRTADAHPRAYRLLVPVFGFGTMLLVVGGVALAGAYYPKA